MNDEFIRSIRDALARDANLLDVIPILRDYRDQGLTAKDACVYGRRHE